ncbi:type II toxin-antitoxin system VapB family antitoxin [Reyranella sp.]|uniref:type II toxin-antitoxin system VapB family antitoxin n=1 Tax=Reyranella sp. TaxID=1929291 RepID=UPI0037851027
MSRRIVAQLNIRSAFARERVREVARRTGMTATEIIEDALRGYVPAAEPRAIGSLVRRGPLLVFPAGRKRKISFSEAEAALEDVRNRMP